MYIYIHIVPLLLSLKVLSSSASILLGVVTDNLSGWSAIATTLISQFKSHHAICNNSTYVGLNCHCNIAIALELKIAVCKVAAIIKVDRKSLVILEFSKYSDKNGCVFHKVPIITPLLFNIASTAVEVTAATCR